MDFSNLKIPIGPAVDAGVDWLTANLSGFFGLVSDFVGTVTSALEWALLFPPPLVVIVLFAGLGWLVRTWKFGLGTLVSFALIVGMGLWSEAMSTLSLVLVSSIFALVIAVPLGIAAARFDRLSSLVRPVLDFMQTMPSFVYLIPAIVFFGIGKVPGVISTIVFALPPAARLTELGLRQVDQEIVEAGEAFGAKPGSILTQIEVPLALPTIMAGVNQMIMLALSMVVIAGIVGAGGLGAVVFRGVTRLDVGLGFEGGLAVVILAVFLDRITAAFGERAADRTSR